MQNHTFLFYVRLSKGYKFPAGAWRALWLNRPRPESILKTNLGLSSLLENDVKQPWKKSFYALFVMGRCITNILGVTNYQARFICEN